MTAAEPAAYLAPDVGFDALKDSVALIKAIASGDDEGNNTILNANPNPRCLAGMVAVITNVICRRVGLSDADIDALLASIEVDLADFLLDQQHPAETGVNCDG